LTEKHKQTFWTGLRLNTPFEGLKDPSDIQSVQDDIDYLNTTEKKM